jgi:hypothetical protein
VDTIAKTMDIIKVAKKVHEEMLIKESRKHNEAAGTLSTGRAFELEMRRIEFVMCV